MRNDPPGDRSTRIFNLLVASAAILVLAPLTAPIGIVVTLSSPGPVLYRQPRVGRDRRREVRSGGLRDRKVRNAGGMVFTMFKFRSMRSMETAPAAEIWAQKSDPRVTAVRRHLRLHRLDEIPQLFNVLRGDMNVVGPRPEQPKLFLELQGRIDGYAKRQTILPGTTGWAQINQPFDQCFDDVRRKVELDLQYLGRRSATEDLRIMLLTLPVIAARRRALQPLFPSPSPRTPPCVVLPHRALDLSQPARCLVPPHLST